MGLLYLYLLLSLKHTDITDIRPVHGGDCDVQCFPILPTVVFFLSPCLYLEYAGAKGVQLVTVITSSVTNTELEGNRNNTLDLSTGTGCQTTLHGIRTAARCVTFLKNVVAT
jgi:hypothetical protein